MCLEIVKHRTDIPAVYSKRKIGYKYFSVVLNSKGVKSSKRVRPVYRKSLYGGRSPETLTIGREYLSTRGTIQSYPAGFHIYRNKKDIACFKRSDIYVAVKVEYDDVVAVGQDRYGDFGETVIARKMKIIEILN